MAFREPIDLGLEQAEPIALPVRKIPGLTGQLPVDPVAALTAAEEAVLSPKDRAILEEARRSVEKEGKERGRNRTLKDFIPPKEEALENLPRHRQEEIRKAVNQARTPPPQPQSQSQSAPLSADEIAFQATADPSIKRWKALIEQQREPVDEPQSGSQEPFTKPAEGAGGAEASRTCPHCGWPQDMPDDALPSDDDQDRHTELLLGGLPFTKAYTFHKGQLTVLYRTLSQEDSERVMNQCVLDANSGEIKTASDFVRLLLDYRLCLSIVEMVLPGPRTLDVAIPVDSYLQTEGATLKELVKKLRKIVPLSQEPIWKVVQSGHRRFQRLSEKLEALSSDPNFSTGGGVPS